jgi:hypothetical protein
MDRKTTELRTDGMEDCMTEGLKKWQTNLRRNEENRVTGKERENYWENEKGDKKEENDREGWENWKKWRTELRMRT